MKFLIDYWSLIVLLVVIFALAIRFAHGYFNKTSEAQLAQLKEWLLLAVILAEKEFKSGTGVLKLHYVYDLALERFPSLMSIISFEQFSLYVDQALETMKKILETNKDIESYVEGE